MVFQMKKIAIIPLRKNSKGILGKNKKKMVGRPLFSWVLSEAIFSNLDTVYVFTDDEGIIEYVNKNYAWSSKVIALLRSNENATDLASTESVLLEFSDKINQDFDLLCLLQATSPLTTSEAINTGIDKIVNENFDSSLSVVKTHRFTWNKNGTPQNYDVFNRPRRQDFEGLLIENGAVYCTTKAAFLNSKNRVSGNIGLVEMPEESLWEIDSKSDWDCNENLLIQRLKNNKKTTKIDYLVLDVDGVFTDGSVYYNENGEFAKRFDFRDGMGLEILRENNIEVVVITSEQSILVKKRMKKLQIEHAFLGVKDKYAFLTNFALDRNIDFGAIAYVGDDVNDLSNLCRAGWSFAPYNATKQVLNHVDIVLNNSSGNGAIREVCEFIINYNNRY